MPDPFRPEVRDNFTPAEQRVALPGSTYVRGRAPAELLAHFDATPMDRLVKAYNTPSRLNPKLGRAPRINITASKDEADSDIVRTRFVSLLSCALADVCYVSIMLGARRF